MSDANTAGKVEAGQALYSKSLLAMYDWAILGIFCRFVCRCPSHYVLEQYNQLVSANHLDIGVGTGYFLDKCRFPTPNPRIALLDLNQNSLQMASKRLARYNADVYRRNVLEPFEIGERRFDSVTLTHLLHCLPGTIWTKGIVFEHVKDVMNPGGVMFGATLLWDGVQRSRLAAFFMEQDNRKGIMTNMEDDLDGLKATLAQHFSDSAVEVVGRDALFWARK